MDVETKQMPAMRLATLHHVGAYNRISEAFGRLGDIAGRAGLFSAKPTMLALYHDDPKTTPEAELSSDAAVVIPEDATVPEGLVEQRLVAGRYACTRHRGPYEGLGDAWARFIGQWLPTSGERLGKGPTFEIYLNNPTDVPKDQLLTDLYIPLS
jgi:AraC family transcriptional regulator